MEELKKRVSSILDQFAKEEIGNRLSNFSMLMLKNLILKEIGSVIQVEKKED